MADESSSRGVGAGAIVVAVLIGGSFIGAVGWYWLTNRKGPALNTDGFDVAAVTPESAPTARYAAPKRTQEGMLIKSDGNLSFSENAAASGGQGQAHANAVAAAAGAAVGSDYDRRAEAAFLARHGAELANYERRLGRITSRYYKDYPVVRQVDKDFARMPRYMAVKDQYARSGDPFTFVRDAIALPEVRNEIAQKMADPAAWVAAIGMVSAALKDPPPPAVYQAAQQFMTGDPAMTAYMSDFTQIATKNAPIIAQSIPPGTDLSALSKLANDVSPGSVPPSR
jgi:hypothetical protein